MMKILRKLKKSHIAVLSVLLLCLIIHTFSLFSKGFSDFFNRTAGAFFRTVLAYLTSWLPFSLAEIFVMLIVPFVIFSVVFIIKNSKNKKRLVSFVLALTFIPIYIYCTFVLTFAVAYRGTPLEEKLGLSRTPLSADELIYVTDILTEKLNEVSGDVNYSESGLSVMPYSFDELNDKLNSAYEKACEKYDFISKLNSQVKSIILSEPMTYTHISGVYTFFTGEANVNVNYPNFITPFTMAHEMAHQRGIAREDEANFTAFLVCLESDDSYILYSAYLNMLEYYFTPLYSADKAAYFAMRTELGPYVNAELSAYSEFFEKYRDTVISDISNTVNNSYLQLQGQPAGRKSYGLVVELTYSYYKNSEN